MPKPKKKTKKQKITTKMIGNLGSDIAIPAAITEGNAPMGANNMAPQTTVSNWPAPELWYAQGRMAAKKAYYEYINVLSQYLNSTDLDPKLSAAGQLNSLVGSMLQGVTLGLDALENIQRKVRIGDQAAVMQKAVVTDTLDKLLKVIWTHNLAADKQLPGLEIQCVEPAVVSRLNHVTGEWKVTDVGIALSSAAEAESLWNEASPQAPNDAPIESPGEQGQGSYFEFSGEEEPGANELPEDEQPAPENQEANDFVNVPDAGEPDEPGQEEFELPDMPEQETQEEEPTQEAAPVPEEEPELPVEMPQGEEDIPFENEEEDMSLVERFQALLAEDPEKAKALLDEAEAPVEEEAPVETAEEAPVEEEEQEAFNQPEEPEEEEETPVEEEEIEETPEVEEVETEDEEDPKTALLLDKIKSLEERLNALEGDEEEPVEEETVEEVEEPEDEEEPIYCIHCDRDVTQADIDACTEEGCPFKQKEEEVIEEGPVQVEEKGYKPPSESHLIMLDHDDHCDCHTHKIKIKDFTGVDGDFCVTCNKMLNYSFDQQIWKSEDAQKWVKKQFKIQKEKDKTPVEIVAEKIDCLSDTVLKAWLEDKREEVETKEANMVEFDSDELLSAFDRIIAERFTKPLESRLEQLEA